MIRVRDGGRVEAEPSGWSKGGGTYLRILTESEDAASVHMMPDEVAALIAELRKAADKPKRSRRKPAGRG